jgi:uncharacterized coiled-coil protein SlyX
LLKKTGKSGKALLKKGLGTFRGVSAFQAAEGITQLVRENLKGTLSILAKSGLNVRAGAAALPVLGTLGFEPGETNRDAWQNFTNVCKESFDYLAANLNENADDPVEASRLASEAFSVALKKVKSERKTAPVQRMTRMAAAPTQKQVVNRTMVIALGLACVVLAAGLVGSIAFYMPMVNSLQVQITEKNSTISSLNSTISSLNSTISSLNQQISALQNNLNQNNVTALNQQISLLTSLLLLNESEYLVDNQAGSLDAGANATVFADALFYAGYVSVAVQSDSSTTYIELAYYSFGVNYDNNVTVGTSGTAVFPVLPTTVEISVGNTETVDSVNATLTATYYY